MKEGVYQNDSVNAWLLHFGSHSWLALLSKAEIISFQFWEWKLATVSCHAMWHAEQVTCARMYKHIGALVSSEDHIVIDEEVTAVYGSCNSNS